MDNYLNDVFPGLDVENLLEDLLGAKNLHIVNDEIIHSCTLNFGLHGHGDQNPSASLNKESLLFNCHVCFTPETWVLTPEGGKRIDQIIVGDLVLTHEGRYRPVKQVFKTQYDGKLVGINTWGQSETIWSTPDHPFYATNKNWCKTHGQFKCRPETCPDVETPELSWTKAKDLQENKSIIARQTIREIKDKEYLDLLPRNERSKSKSSLKLDKIYITEDFCRLVGYYFAEGFTVSRNNISFCFNHDEISYIEDIKNICQSEFFLSVTHENGEDVNWKYGHVDYLRLNSRALVDLFLKEFGTGSKTKSLPIWFMTLPHNKQKAFIQGLFYGDGHLNQNLAQLVLANPALVSQVWQILARLGVYGNLSRENRGPYNIKGRTGLTSDVSSLVWYNSKNPELFKELWDFDEIERQKRAPSHEWAVKEDYTTTSIRKIQEKEFSGYVYNLEVEEDNSYVVNTLVVHNCGGGTIIWLVQNTLDVPKNEAINKIKNYAEMLRPIPVEEFVMRLERLFKEQGYPQELIIPRYSSKILDEWTQPSEYLLERGVSYEVQKQMKTGVLEPRYETDKITKEPVLVQRNILPHFIDNDLVGWVSRRLDDTQNVAKYRNSRSFPRKYSLYNLNNIADNSHCYVVESPMSVLVLKSRGINDVVATFGAQVSDEQVKILRRFDNLTIYMDGDKAGQEGATGLYRRLREVSDVRLVLTPNGEDPASLIEVPNSVSGVEFAMTTKMTGKML